MKLCLSIRIKFLIAKINPVAFTIISKKTGIRNTEKRLAIPLAKYRLNCPSD
jgi:hypothetical protein